MLTTALLVSLLAPQGNEELLSSRTVSLPTLGIDVRDERLLDRASGRILRRTTNAATGEIVDGDRLRADEIAARDANTGKLGRDLEAKIAQGGSMQIAFWLRRPAGMPDLRGILDAAIANGVSPEEARRTALATAKSFVTRTTEPFVKAVQDAGLATDYVDEFAPIVFVTLDAAQIENLAKRDDVDKAYWTSTEWETETLVDGSAAGTTFMLPNEWASPSARTDAVHRRGINGAGVKVMVNDTAPMALNNPFLPSVTQGFTGSAASHATAVAGIICSTHDPHTGAAPGLTEVYDYGRSGDTGAPMAWSWAMTQGVSFGNCSWWNRQRGQINMLDRYFDYIIRNFAVMMFKSCGNQGNNQPVTTPGNGYNVTSSGCASDNNTHDWDDDSMASFSSTRNPTQGHEKPEVVAHGSGITSTRTSSPWIGSSGSGTSYASPVTCGSAALLAQTDSALQAKPEVVKAMLMAGAWNNVHGGSPLSDFDGAGGIHAGASQQAVADGQYVSTTLTPGSFTAGIWSQQIALDAGDETRVVALWFSTADSSYSTDVLNMDLDMTVEDPSGAVVATSASSANPFEIVSFIPGTTGTYTVKLTNQRFDGANEPFALAWTTGQDAATDTVTVTGSPTIGSTLTFDFEDTYHPGETYLGLVSLTPYPALTALPVGRVLGFGYDGLAQASLAGLLPGFFGALDSNGQATASFPILPIPALRGRTFYYGMLTVESTAPEAEETSPVGSFTIQ